MSACANAGGGSLRLNTMMALAAGILPQCFADGVVEDGVRRNLLIVVEDQDTPGFPPSEEGFEEDPEEGVQIGPVLVGKRRERFGSQRLLTDRQSYVVKQRGEVGVAVIDLVPKVPQISLFEIVADQRGLPGAWRRRNPDQW
jgi:hypothetical protein